MWVMPGWRLNLIIRWDGFEVTRHQTVGLSLTQSLRRSCQSHPGSNVISVAPLHHHPLLLPWPLLLFDKCNWVKWPPPIARTRRCAKCDRTIIFISKVVGDVLGPPASWGAGGWGAEAAGASLLASRHQQGTFRKEQWLPLIARPIQEARLWCHTLPLSLQWCGCHTNYLNTGCGLLTPKKQNLQPEHQMVTALNMHRAQPHTHTVSEWPTVFVKATFYILIIFLLLLWLFLTFQWCSASFYS